MNESTAYPDSEPECTYSQWSEGTKGRGKLSQGRKAPPDRPALKPYWRKFDVRNFRGDHGNIGIIEARLAPWSYPTSYGSVSEALGAADKAANLERWKSFFCQLPVFGQIADPVRAEATKHR